MIEMSTQEVASTVVEYWRDILRIVKVPDADLTYSVYNYDMNVLSEVVKSFTPDELSAVVHPCDENTKFLRMRRVWYRYLDVVSGKSTIKSGECVEFSNMSNVSELEISRTTLRELISNEINMLGEIPYAMANNLISQVGMSDIMSAFSVFNSRRNIC